MPGAKVGGGEVLMFLFDRYINIWKFILCSILKSYFCICDAILCWEFFNASSGQVSVYQCFLISGDSL